MKEMKKEQIVSPRIELTEKIHEELRVSLELERKLLKKEFIISMSLITDGLWQLVNDIETLSFVLQISH